MLPGAADVHDDLVLCTRHRPDDVRACLETVRAQTCLPTTTLVVDSSGDDATERVVSELCASWPSHGELRYLRSEPPTTHQRNVGIDATHHEVVHFVDDDTLLEPGYVEGIRAVFAADVGTEVGGAGGFVTNQPPHRFRTIDVWLGLDSPREGAVLPSGRNVRVHDAPAHDVDVDWLSGCAMSFRRGALEVERPDEHLGALSNGEDVDLAYRVRQRARLVVTPHARLAHLESPVDRRGAVELAPIELVSRWRRVRTGIGALDRRAFWVSAWGQLAWYGAKGAATLSGERLGIARGTWRGIREIRRVEREERAGATRASPADG